LLYNTVMSKSDLLKMKGFLKTDKKPLSSKKLHDLFAKNAILRFITHDKKLKKLASQEVGLRS